MSLSSFVVRLFKFWSQGDLKIKVLAISRDSTSFVQPSTPALHSLV
jgi:hypothetical protein